MIASVFGVTPPGTVVGGVKAVTAPKVAASGHGKVQASETSVFIEPVSLFGKELSSCGFFDHAFLQKAADLRREGFFIYLSHPIALHQEMTFPCR